MKSRSTDAPVPLGEFIPTADQRLILRGQTWSTFKALLGFRGERTRPRIAYLDGTVELMELSRNHEVIRAGLACLLEAYCHEREITWTSYGSWLLENETYEVGVQPDECYVFGAPPSATPVPDLAIEVAWTSGGIDKLEIYRRIGVREVWYWKTHALSVYVLGPSGYTLRMQSTSVPGIDLTLLSRLAEITPIRAAVTKLREIMRAPR